MTQGQYNRSSYRRPIPEHSQNLLLQQHPVLVPVLFLSSSLILGTVSFFADVLFPIIALIRFPSAQLGVSFSLVLGAVGLLTSIIGIIEYIDRHSFPTAMFARPKEQSYANRN